MTRIFTIVALSLLLSVSCVDYDVPYHSRAQGVWVGSRVGSSEAGVRLFAFDPFMVTLEERGRIDGIRSPTWIAPKDARHAIVASEVSDVGPRKEGELAVLSFDGEKLVEIERRPSGGSGPCHVSRNVNQDLITVAHYGDGAIAVHRLGRDGRFVGEPLILEAEDLGPLRSDASGAVNPRQAAPHAHQTVSSLSDGSLLLTDLGRDRIFLIPVDRDGRIAPKGTTIRSIATAPGSGPRHLALDELRGRLLVVGELTSTVEVFTFERTGPNRLRRLFESDWSNETPLLVSTVAKGIDATKIYPSAIISVGDGVRYYVANRGNDTIALIELERDGTPQLAATFPCGGKTPWDIGLSPDGTILYVAAYGSNELILLPVDDKTGRLGEPILRHPIEKPTCVVPVEASVPGRAVDPSK